MRKLSITIDDELYAQLKRTIGSDDLSEYVADAVRDRLESEESLEEDGLEDDDEDADEEELDGEDDLDEDEDWEEEEGSEGWNSEDDR